MKRTKLRNIVKKGYHSEEERPIASSPSESDDSELDIVARENMMTGRAAARRRSPGRDSSVDDDEDSDSHDASSSAPDESSAEVAESESSDSIAEHARQPVRQTRHKPSANKNIATRNKVYDEDKHMKPDRPKVKPQAMRRGFDEIHYMKVTGAGYATERDDLKYLNESGAESVEESKHSFHSVKQSHKPESDSDSESDEVINEKLGLLNEGIKDNLKEMCVIEPDKPSSDSDEESKHKEYDFSEDFTVSNAPKRAGLVKRTELGRGDNFEPITDMERATYQARIEKFDSNYDMLLNRLQLNFGPESLPCRDKEKEVIREFIQSGLRNRGSSTSLYISGMPGTGKTATTLEVIKKLNEERKKRFKFIHVNGMQLNNSSVMYSLIYKEITGQKHKPTTAAVLLDDYFKKKDLSEAQLKHQQMIVLLVDELDALVTK